jgi:hypothetical protein
MTDNELPVLDELERRLVARCYPTGRSRGRQRHWLGWSFRSLVSGGVLVFGPLIAILIAVGGLVLVAHRGPVAGSAGGMGSKSQLIDEYAVLRRAQTQRDRTLAGPLPDWLSRPARRVTNPGFHRTGKPEGSAHVTTIPSVVLYADVPALTRVVVRDGVRVSLFVLRSRSNPAYHAQRSERIAGYALLARVGSGRKTMTALGPMSGINAALPTPDGHVVSVVPDQVARVRWVWPRQFDPATFTFVPALTRTAPVLDNVAIARAHRAVPPQTTIWYAAGGQVIARLINPNEINDGGAEYMPADRSRPGPETSLSRRAERNPATPNPVVVAPPEGSRATGYNVYFHALLNGHGYEMRLTGPRPGCAGEYAKQRLIVGPAQPLLRGNLIQTIMNVVPCTGVYHLSVAVIGAHNHAYRPFGSATFTVH